MGISLKLGYKIYNDMLIYYYKDNKPIHPEGAKFFSKAKWPNLTNLDLCIKS